MTVLQKKQRALLSAIITLFWFAQYVYIPYQTPFLQAQAVSSSMIGVVVGAYGMTQMLARLPVGLAADTLSRHRFFILAGGLCAGGASLLRLVFPSGGGFLAANLFSGLASAMWISFMVLYTSYYSTGEQQKGTSHVILFNNVGMLAGFISATLLYGRLGMQILCTLSCGAGMLAALLSLGLREPAGISVKKPAVRELLAVCKGRRLLFFSALAILQQGIQMSTTMSFTTQILKERGATAAVIGLSSVFYMLCAVASSAFASSRFCAKGGPNVWIPATLLLMTAYCTLVPLAPAVWMLFLLQLLPGMSTGILFSYLTSEAMVGIPAQAKSTAMGCYQAIYAIGMTLFPVLTGKIAHLWSMQAAFAVLAVLALLGAAAAVVCYRKETAHV